MKKRLLSLAFGALLALLMGEIFFSVLESSREADVRALNRIPEGESWNFTGGVFTPVAERAAYRGPTGNPHDFFVEDSELGFRLRPNLRALPGSMKRAGDTIYDVAYSTSRFGWRLTPEPSGAAGVTAFFGGTNLFGLGLKDAETLPARFSQYSGKPALNYGVPGWSATQAFRLLELKLEAPALQGNRISGAYFLLAREPRIGGRAQACSWSALCEAARTYFKIGTQELSSIPEAQELAGVLSRIEGQLRMAGFPGKLTVVLWNTGDPALDPLEGALKERSLDVVSLRSLLPDLDGQPSAKAMDELAKALAAK